MCRYIHTYHVMRSKAMIGYLTQAKLNYRHRDGSCCGKPGFQWLVLLYGQFTIYCRLAVQSLHHFLLDLEFLKSCHHVNFCQVHSKDTRFGVRIVCLKFLDFLVPRMPWQSACPGSGTHFDQSPNINQPST